MTAVHISRIGRCQKVESYRGSAMMDIVKGPGVDLLDMVAQLEGGDTEKTAVIEAIQQIQKEVSMVLYLNWAGIVTK